MASTDTVLTSPEAAPASKPARPRLDTLDAGRGLAALAVAIGHLFEALTNKLLFINRDVISLGTFGVIAFFMISGYVIPISLERSKSLVHFWVNRFFRLYPIYWVSILIAAPLAIVLQTQEVPGPAYWTDFVGNTFWNLSMVHLWFDRPSLQPPYWTLNYEMFFYVLCSGFYLLRLKRGPEIGLYVISALFLAVAFGILPAYSVSWFQRAFWIGSFFVGTMLFQIRERPDLRSQSIRAAGSFYVCALVGWGIILSKFWFTQSWPIGVWTSPVVEVVSWIAGHLMVLGLLFLKLPPMPKPLLYLGTVSYTLYLFHGLPLLMLPPGSVVIRFLFWVVITGVMVPILYRTIEEPTMGLGKALLKEFESRFTHKAKATSTYPT